QLKYLAISNFIEFFRIFDNSWIAGKNAIYVGENLAGVGVQRAGQRNRRQIRSATAKRGCFSFRRLPLKPCHDDDVVVCEELVNLFRAYVRDTGTGVIA